MTPWPSERVLVLTDWTHRSWESQQPVNGHTKSHDICSCIALGRCHLSSKQEWRQRKHRPQHSYGVVMMGTGTSRAELLLCHRVLGLCGFLTAIHQLNLARVWQTIHIADIMNRRRTAWTVPLPCLTVLLCCFLSQQHFMVRPKGQPSSFWQCLLFLIQSDPHNTCSKFVTRLFTSFLMPLCCSDGNQEPPWLHIPVGALLKTRQALCPVLLCQLSTSASAPAVWTQPVQNPWLSTPLCCSLTAATSLMLEAFLQVFTNRS